MILSDQQKEIVDWRNGAAVVVATAGSGKTRCLVERTAAMVEDGIWARSILIFTFTRKAAAEIRERISERLEDAEMIKDVQMSTYHGFALKLIRKDPEAAGLKEDFSVWSDEITQAELKRVLADLMLLHTQEQAEQQHFLMAPDGKPVLGIGGRDYNPLIRDSSPWRNEPQALFPATTELAGLMRSVSDRTAHPDDIFRAIVSLRDDPFEYRLAAHCISQYWRNKNACNALDYDDFMPFASKAVLTGSEAISKYLGYLRHVMLDEFQDTSPDQAAFFRAAFREVQPLESIMAVGDDDQSIYRFRGADPSSVQTFISTWEAQILPLGANYRCSAEIVEAADQLVSHNDSRIPKHLWSHSGSRGIGVNVTWSRNYFGHIDDLVTTLWAAMSWGAYLPSQTAILARTNMDLFLISKALHRKQIECRRNGEKDWEGKDFPDHEIAGQPGVWKGALWKRISAFLTCLLNPLDTGHAETVVGLIPKLGQVAITHWRSQCKDERYTDHPKLHLLSSILFLPRKGPKTLAGRHLSAFLKWWKELEQLPIERSLSSLVRDLLTSPYFRRFVSFDMVKSDKDERRVTRDRLYSSVILSRVAVTDHDHPDSRLRDKLRIFIDQISTAEAHIESSDNRITLSTIHAAKGLEWDTVFVVNCMEGSLPHLFALKSLEEADIQEERRILYVAMTRAKTHLYLCGFSELSMQGPARHIQGRSRFLDELRCPNDPTSFDSLPYLGGAVHADS